MYVFGSSIPSYLAEGGQLGQPDLLVSRPSLPRVEADQWGNGLANPDLQRLCLQRSTYTRCKQASKETIKQGRWSCEEGAVRPCVRTSVCAYVNVCARPLCVRTSVCLCASLYPVFKMDAQSAHKTTYFGGAQEKKKKAGGGATGREKKKVPSSSYCQP